MYDHLVNFISCLGFPITVSIYLLLRFENRILSLEKSIYSLKADLSAVIKCRKGKQK
ncbi:YvrJ family protein [Clostridium sp. LBM24168]